MNFLLLIPLILIGLSHGLTEKRIVCYHQSWTTYRPAKGKFDVSTINPKLCTHLVYAYVKLSSSAELVARDEYLEGMQDNFGKFVQLKEGNPKLKVMASVGGWDDGSSKIFSDIAAQPKQRQTMISNAIKFITEHKFDGLELAWCFPGQRGGDPNNDRNNYVLLVKEMKKAFSEKKLILSALAVGLEWDADKAYNIKEIPKYLDFINIICFDLFGGSWTQKIGIPGQLYGRSKEHSADSIITSWTRKGAPREKLNLGIGFHGRTFKLANENRTTPGSLNDQKSGGGSPKQYTKEKGLICYIEACEIFENEKWQFKWDSERLAPYAHRGSDWIGYENSRSIELKARYVNEMQLGGIMILNMECDDFSGKFCPSQGTGEKFPLLKTINSVFKSGETIPEYQYYIETKIVKVNLKFNHSKVVFENKETFYLEE